MGSEEAPPERGKAPGVVQLKRSWSYSSLATAQMALLGTDNVCTEFVLYGTIGAFAGTS